MTCIVRQRAVNGNALEHSAIGDGPFYMTVDQGTLASVVGSTVAEGDSCVNVLTLVPRQHQY